MPLFVDHVSALCLNLTPPALGKRLIIEAGELTLYPGRPFDFEKFIVPALVPDKPTQGPRAATQVWHP